MKVKAGSLQCKKGWYYLVTSEGGHKTWTALHTRDETEAQALAVEKAPPKLDATPETDRLRAIMADGERARRQLASMLSAQTASAIPWEGLFERWRAGEHTRKGKPSELTSSPATLKKYRCQLNVLTNWALARSVTSPVALSARQAQEYASARKSATVISGRDVALFSRVWRDLNFADIWGAVSADSPSKTAASYRRLSVPEVRALVAAARSGAPRVRRAEGWFEPGGYDAVPDVADLIALSYHTGLRRCDCQHLTVGSVDGDFLRVVPEKTGRAKVKPLNIPLQPEAAGLVKRLVDGREDPRAPLFPRLFNAWLDITLRKTFKRAGVESNAFGLASFHSLRATFISMMDEAGVSAHITDAITGHAKQGMHGRYTQPGRDALMDAVRKAITPLDQSPLQAKGAK